MTFDDYQTQASATAVYPRVGQNRTYPLLGLIGEIGELANKVKKVERDHPGVGLDALPDLVADLRDELGDVLWYTAIGAREHGFGNSMDFATDFNYEPMDTILGEHNDGGDLTLALAATAAELIPLKGRIDALLLDTGDADPADIPSDIMTAISGNYTKLLWLIAIYARALRTTVDEIATMNLRKLKDRQERGVLQGAGDNR